MSYLVLTRKKEETIVVYTENPHEVLCEIAITALGAKQVKLAFEAKPNIRIDRKEVYDEGRRK